MKVLAPLLLLLLACGDNIPPSCPDVGCPDSAPLYCTQAKPTLCSCPQDDGAKIECIR